MTKKLIGLIPPMAALLLLSGCLSAQRAVQVSPDTYMVRVEDHGGIFAFNRGKMKGRAVQEANEFATSKNMVAVAVSIKEHPCGILGDWPAVEYQFLVVPKDDPDAIRNPLKPESDLLVDKSHVGIDLNLKNESSNKTDVYAELIKLDDLKKRGIITESEFDIQKKKLLEGK